MNPFDYIYELCIDPYRTTNKGFPLKKIMFHNPIVFLLYRLSYDLGKKILIVFPLYECEISGNKHLVNSFH